MSSALLANLRTKKEPKKLNPITIKFGKKLNSLPILDKRQEDDMKNRTNILSKFNKANPVKNDQSIFENEPIQPAFRSTKDTVEDTVEDTTYVPKYNSKLIVVKLKERLILTPSAKLLEEPGIINPTNRTRFTEKPTGIIKDIPSSQLIIKGVPLSSRFKQKEELPKLPVPGYYMNNRKIFIQFIANAFSKYKIALKDDAKNATCDYDDNAQFQVMTHQRIVQDYLNLHTPYRGLLLFHGLGSGKTCSSIAIAEGLKTSKGVIVMTPASLRRNYIEELKKCGDDLYRKNQFWEFINTKDYPELIEPLSSVLNISVNFIKRNRGAWLVNVKNPSNFESLSSESKANLDKQLYEMIRAKYQFINYNGMRNSHLEELTLNYSINPFDNKVIIIDEAHNLVSRIVNKLSRKETLSNKLYKYLQEAKNCRIVLLSGTPIINYPNEIAILFNILRGNIDTWSFKLKINDGKKVNLKYLQKILKTKFGGNIIDYMDYKSSSTSLIVTRNPFEFVNVENKSNYEGVILSSQGVSDKQFEENIIKTLEKPSNNIKVINTVKNSYKALPDTLDDFKKQFMDKNDNLVDMNSFKRRIIGLTSYFRSAQEGLMPEYSKTNNFKIVRIPMSQYQFGVYEEARVTERKLELQNSKKRKKNQNNVFDDSVSTYRIFSRAFCNFVFPKEIKRPMPSKDGNLESAIVNGDEDVIDAVPLSEKMENKEGKYDIDDISEESSKLALEIPDDGSNKTKQIGGADDDDSAMSRLDKASQDIIDNVTEAVSNTTDNITDAVSKAATKVKSSVSDITTNIGDKVSSVIDIPEVPKKTKKKPKGLKKKIAFITPTKDTTDKPKDVVSNEPSNEPSASNEPSMSNEPSASNEPSMSNEPTSVSVNKSSTKIADDTPIKIRKTAKKTTKKTMKSIPATIAEEDSKATAEPKTDEPKTDEPKTDEPKTDEPIILPAKTAIPVNYEERIHEALSRLNKDKDLYLTPEKLQIYSPKFLNILENIIDINHKGLHLIYSQFRTLEGIGILKLILEANGFAQFKIKENGPGNWLLNMTEEEISKPKFVLYTGTESQEEKEIVRNVYNGDWKYVPTGLAKQLLQLSENNLYGEVIKVFMITASGAEGISLKNTRYVHITEPYWHPVRMEQVIGRAKRICSHQGLPQEERTVDVFLYLMILSEEQKTSDESIELRLKDKSKIDNITPFTSDQTLYELATIKENITTQILKAVKETAFDCVLHTTKGNKEGLQCFTFGNPLPDQFSYKPSLSEEDKDAVSDINKKEVTMKNLKVVHFDGVDRLVNMLTGDVYDYEQFQNNVYIKVGTLIKSSSPTGEVYTFEPIIRK